MDIFTSGRISLISLLLLTGCTLKVIPAKEYEWKLDTAEIDITSDTRSVINVVGSYIPENIEWRAIPDQLVSLNVSEGGKCCEVQYLADGEGEIIARYGESESVCLFTSRKYSKTGLHLKINGTDRFFPLIPHNGEGDGLSKITRIYNEYIPPDTLKLEICNFIPEETKDKIIIKNLYLVDSGHHYECNHFITYFDPFRVSDSAISYLDNTPNFYKIEGTYLEQSAFVKHPNTESITFEVNTNAFENIYGGSCCFRIIFNKLQ